MYTTQHDKQTANSENEYHLNIPPWTTPVEGDIQPASTLVFHTRLNAARSLAIISLCIHCVALCWHVSQYQLRDQTFPSDHIRPTSLYVTALHDAAPLQGD